MLKFTVETIVVVFDDVDNDDDNGDDGDDDDDDDDENDDDADDDEAMVVARFCCSVVALIIFEFFLLSDVVVNPLLKFTVEVIDVFNKDDVFSANCTCGWSVTQFDVPSSPPVPSAEACKSLK